MLAIDPSGGEFKINRSSLQIGVIGISHSINVHRRICTCGKWQDREYPCIDAMAYYRNIAKLSLKDILEQQVSSFYNCRSLYLLWKTNICPVIISTLEYDRGVLPPFDVEQIKRQSGRPRVKRFRPRPTCNRPEDSKIVCKKCGDRGHNSRTCELRKALENAREKYGNKGNIEEKKSTTDDVDNETNTNGNIEDNKSTTDGVDNETTTAGVTCKVIDENEKIISDIQDTNMVNSEITDTFKQNFSMVEMNNDNTFSTISQLTQSQSDSINLELIMATDPGYKTNIL